MADDLPHGLDDPEKKARIVRLLVWLTPAMFALCWFLAWIQGAEANVSLLIAGVGAGMCAAAAGVIHLMGSKSWMALVALKIALLLVKR